MQKQSNAAAAQMIDEMLQAEMPKSRSYDGRMLTYEEMFGEPEGENTVHVPGSPRRVQRRCLLY